MILHKQRKAFSILTALFIIILMSSVGALVSSVSSKTIKTSVNQYQRVQAVLLAKSYTELAIMAVTANDRTVNCVDIIRGNYAEGGGYTVMVNITYIGDPAVTNLGTCTDTFASTDDTLNIIVDTYVSYQDLDNPNGTTITYHRRTVQKI